MQLDVTKLKPLLTLDPGTLRQRGRGLSDLAPELYRAYGHELAPLTAALPAIRKRMADRGEKSYFFDIEAEMLYLLIRATRPQTAIEISPCYGYSTNYMLAALNANGSGILHSYEITTEFRGRDIETIIRGNLATDASRLRLHIGDATKATIPSSDFALIDSNHEAWFSAWYMTSVVPRAKICMVHDIVQPVNGTLVPKAYFLGPREAGHTLQTLHYNSQGCFALCGLLVPPERSGLTTRIPGEPDRSVLFLGHAQSAEAESVHRAQQDCYELSQLALLGDRDTVMERLESLADSAQPFVRFCAGAVYAQLGYRGDQLRQSCKRTYDSITEALHSVALTAAEYSAALEAGRRLYAPEIVTMARRAALRSGLSPDLTRVLYCDYRPQGWQLPYLLSRLTNRLVRALPAKGGCEHSDPSVSG